MDKERIETYLQTIAMETAAIIDILQNSDALILFDRKPRMPFFLITSQ